MASLLITVYLIWALYVIYVVTATIGSILHSIIFRNKSWRKCMSENSVDIVFTSKATRSVVDVLVESIRETRRRLPLARIWVVVDEGAEGIPVLKRYSSVYRFLLVVVPKEYRKGMFKARAMNYFAEFFADNNRWYVFLDDDSYPLDKNFLCEINTSIHVYNGVLCPRLGRSFLTWLMDSARFFFDISIARFMLRVLHRPLAGLHGELLIVHGSVLRSIGFDTDSTVEDAWFASRLLEKGYRVSQVDTLVSILSPNSIVDLWRQRGRWYTGWLRELIRGGFTGAMRLVALLHVTVWSLAPIGLIMLVLGLLGLLPPEARPPEYLLPILNLGFIMLLLSYTIHPLRRANLWITLIALALAPLLAFIEALSTVYTWVHIRELMENFYVVDKSLGFEEPLAPRTREASPIGVIITENILPLPGRSPRAA